MSLPTLPVTMLNAIIPTAVWTFPLGIPNRRPSMKTEFGESFRQCG
jgi:hypothetical protein